MPGMILESQTMGNKQQGRQKCHPFYSETIKVCKVKGGVSRAYEEEKLFHRL